MEICPGEKITQSLLIIHSCKRRIGYSRLSRLLHEHQNLLLCSPVFRLQCSVSSDGKTSVKFAGDVPADALVLENPRSLRCLPDSLASDRALMTCHAFRKGGLAATGARLPPAIEVPTPARVVRDQSRHLFFVPSFLGSEYGLATFALLVRSEDSLVGCTTNSSASLALCSDLFPLAVHVAQLLVYLQFTRVGGRSGTDADARLVDQLPGKLAVAMLVSR